MFALGTTVTVSGVTLNDFFAAGDSVIFKGQAREDVRLAALETARLEGRFEQSLWAAGKTVAMKPESLVEKDAALVGESVIVEGHVAGGLYVAAYRATLRGKVDGNVRILADDISILPGTEIGGNLVYTSKKELFLNDQVMLGGQLIRKSLQAGALPNQPADFQSLLSLQIFYYLAALVAGIPFVTLFPNLTGRAVRQVRISMWKCALVGLVVFCLLPLLGLFALLTLIGLPLGLLLLAAYFIMLYLAKIFVALAVGGAVFRWKGPQSFSRAFSALSMGLLVLYTAEVLPWIGGAIWMLVVFMGLGALALALASREGTLPPPLAKEAGRAGPEWTTGSKQEKKKE